MLGLGALSESALSAFPVFEPLVRMEGEGTLAAEATSDLFEMLATPEADIVFVAEIFVGTITDRLSA